VRQAAAQKAEAAIEQHLPSFGKRNDRPELEKALAACKKQKAKLVIAKLDRLSRNLAFIAALMDSGVEFIAVDKPHANKLTIHILAAVAQHEREIISARTSAALKAAKARGKRLGNPKLSDARRHAAAARKENADRYCANVLPVIQEISHHSAPHPEEDGWPRYPIKSSIEPHVRSYRSKN
jgi:DNA invertase Pin-like site-specific DNA recombinase